MSHHPSREQLIGYRERSLSASDLVAVDGHIAACQDCRRALSELDAQSSQAAMVSAIQEAAGEHLTYDQMDAWVEDQLDQSGRELVMAHIGLCSSCARQLEAYESYAPSMSAPVQRAAPAPSFAERVRAFARTPRFAAIATAALLLALLSPLVLVKRTENARREFAADLRNNGTASTAAAPGIDTTELDALPASLRAGALAAVTAKPSERPAALRGLAPNSDPDVVYPVSEVIEEAVPDLRWSSFADAYVVSLFDAQRRLVARSPMLTDTHWQSSAALDRGALYTWEVEGGGMTHQAAFRVLSQRESAEFARVRANSPGPLALGAVAQSLGLLSVAQQEYQTLAEGRHSSQGTLLLDRVNALRGR